MISIQCEVSYAHGRQRRDVVVGGQPSLQSLVEPRHRHVRAQHAGARRGARDTERHVLVGAQL